MKIRKLMSCYNKETLLISITLSAIKYMKEFTVLIEMKFKCENKGK